MKHEWIDLGPLEEFPEGSAVLRKEGAQRFACVRVGDAVHAIDDRCPHQGYPLSQGTVAGCVLTCDWHNWKFDVSTGENTFGGEPVRRYPTRVDEQGRVHLDRALDRAAEARRLVAGLRAALVEDQTARALREGLRLGELGIVHRDEAQGLGKLYAALEIVTRDGAERAQWGFDHGLAALADLCSWAERGSLRVEEAFAAGAHGVAEPSLHLAPRASQTSKSSMLRAMDLVDFEGADPDLITSALTAERREEAEARVRAVAEHRGAEAAARALLPFATRHLYDYGHGLIFLSKGLELAKRFPAAAVEVMASLTVMLGWATAETSLPPFRATQEAMNALDRDPLPAPSPSPARAWDRAAFERAVLDGEKHGVESALAELRAGTPAIDLLRALGHAAAVRLSRFDRAWEARLDAEVGVLDVTHAVTFAEAAIALAPLTAPRDLARLAIIGAGFVGKIRHGDQADVAPLTPASGATSRDVIDAVESRDLARAMAAITSIALERGARRAVYEGVARFAALTAATRPIFYAHTIKNTEALRRLDDGDDAADGAYLLALVSYLAPVRRENSFARVAAVATKFMEDGRPPEGLY